MSEGSYGLSRLSLPDIRALQAALATGQLPVPLTVAGLSSLGLGREAERLVDLLGSLGRDGVRVAVEVAIAEREHRPPPHLDLVWTGPETQRSVARDTWVVVRQLFATARRTVLVGGFSFDHGEDIFRPLHEVMVDHGVTATFFLDIDGNADTVAGGKEYAVRQIDRFFSRNWPFGSPRPDVYYDPRTAVPGPPWASLHAKCVVADDRKALITSANFTDRGQTRNIEAGVLIEDDEFSRTLGAQWRTLVSSRLVHRYEG